MAEPLIHFVVPFIALRSLGVDTRRALIFSLLALTPDLDVLFHVHRSISHSLIPLLMVSVPLLALMWRRGEVRRVVLLATASVSSHLLLDLSGYTPILYPILKDSVKLKLGLGFHMGSAPVLTLELGILTKPTTFTHLLSLDAPLFTAEGITTSLILLTPILLEHFREWRIWMRR